MGRRLDEPPLLTYDCLMRIFEPHIHMSSRTTDDYERMALSGIVAVTEPAFWLGQPRRHAGTFFDYFDSLLDFEVRRAGDYGIDHYATLAVNPREANDEALADQVLAKLPEYLKHPRVVGVGEIGFDNQTPAEERVMRRQIEMAISAKLPLLVHLPHRQKKEGTERTIALMKEMKVSPDLVLIDHNTEETTPLCKEWGCWAGHTVYPRTKLSPERFANIVDEHGIERMLVNSSADWGPSDPLNVPKSAQELRRRGYSEEKIQKIVWDNPVAFFGQSGRLSVRK